MAKLISFKKGRTLFKAFVEPQFKYCPIAWMFQSRRTNSLRIVYDDDDQLPDQDKSVCIHHQNSQIVQAQLY